MSRADDLRETHVEAAIPHRCSSNVNVPALGGSGLVVWCAREPHYANGPHRASVIGLGRRAGDHDGADGELHPADITIEWRVE